MSRHPDFGSPLFTRASAAYREHMRVHGLLTEVPAAGAVGSSPASDTDRCQL
jgi:hypothetical protein